MKKIIFYSIVCCFLNSCVSVKQIGNLNMVSNRNVDPKLNYSVLTTYTGGSKKELKKTRAKTIEDAINETVRRVPGGEFLMNVKVYIVNGLYYAVEGDVWGTKENQSFKGFKAGDKVNWKTKGNIKTGIIKSLKDDKSCIVENEDGELIEKEYTSLTKVQ